MILMFKFFRKSFFSGYREVFGRLDQSQVDGIEFLLGKIEADPRWASIEEIAYALSTIDHETAHTFQPIVEKRASKTRQPKLWASQNRYWKTNHQGRGYIQLTWPENYERYGIKDDPDKALDPELAYEILTDGMHKGVYTGKKLSDYINEREVDYFQARRIVNALDDAGLIAKNAAKFEAILSTSAQDAKAESIAHVEAAVLSPEKKPVATEAKVVVQAEVAKETNPKEKAEVSGPKSWIAAVTTFMASAGAGVFSWAKGASTEIVVAFFASAALVGVVYVVARYWYRNKENQRLADVQLAREKMAQEITLMKMRSAMQQESNTVEVAH